jgi:hypothetical protein
VVVKILAALLVLACWMSEIQAQSIQVVTESSNRTVVVDGKVSGPLTKLLS